MDYNLNQMEFIYIHFNINTEIHTFLRRFTSKTNACLVWKNLDRIVSFIYINKETIYDAKKLAKIHDITFNKICKKKLIHTLLHPQCQQMIHRHQLQYVLIYYVKHQVKHQQKN